MVLSFNIDVVDILVMCSLGGEAGVRQTWEVAKFTALHQFYT